MEHQHEQLRALIGQYYEQVKELQQTVGELEEQLASLPKKISYYDLIQSDLLHELELMPLNAVQGTKVLQQLKKVRKERRLYKNIQLFAQQEQKNMTLFLTMKVSTSPLETTKTYTYRTIEGYELHQSLHAAPQQVIKPPKEKRAKLEVDAIDGYHIVRDNKQWQLFERDVFIAAYRQLSAMHAYLEEHNIQVQSVNKHQELFTHYIVSS